MKERQKILLDTVINNYIETAEPVGSKIIHDRYELQLSTATIRHELNELEKDGFLTHIHTSSGRIPTDKGYRLFVDSLTNLSTLPVEHRQIIEKQIQTIGNNIHTILGQITDVLSNILDYTTIVVTPDIYNNILKIIHLILVDMGKILVVLLNSIGSNQEFVINISEEVSQEELNKISKLLTEKLKGKCISNIDQETLRNLIEELPQFKVLLKTLLREVHKMSQTINKDKQLLIKGTVNMLKLPEFQNIELTRQILQTLEEDKLLCTVLSTALTEKKTCVLIGKENQIDSLNECSIVMAPIETAENDPISVIGVLGPKRMAYPIVVPMIQQVVDMIKNFIKNKKEG